MEKEKILNQPSSSSSKANMPRDTVETLKQIQKQGLSISIVKSGGGPSATPVENRSKATVLPADKTGKLTPIAPRPQTTTESKVQIAPRLTNVTDPRILSSVRVTTHSAIHDNKAVANQSRSNQSAIPETKGFSQSWNNPCSSVDKSPATVSRPVVSTAVNKVQTGSVRVLMPDNKNPVNRGNQNMHCENKNQARVSAAQRLSQSQQQIEGKIQNNQDRINTTPSDSKGFPNQGRTGQQFIVSQDTKAVPVQKIALQKVAEVKSTNQLNTNKPIDVKTPQVNRIAPNMKVMSDANQNKARANFVVKPEGKPNITVASPMIVENKTLNSVRLFTNVDGNATRTTQCKSSSTQMRLPPTALGEAQASLQTKMICTSVTKIISIQSVPGTPENKVILQGAKVTAQTASDMIQKTSTVFEATEASHGNQMAARISTAKRSATVVTSPLKKKCVKRTPPTTSSEISNKSTDGNNLNSPEEGKGETRFFNNLKTSRTGLTITPVQSGIVSVPSSSASPIGVVRMTGEILENWEKHAAMVKSPRGKSRGRGRRRYIEPVCLTLSSDEEEEHMQAPFNNFEAVNFFKHVKSFSSEPQESEGSKSGHSSPEEDNPESDDPQFPGVTDINPRIEEPYEDEEEDQEENEMDDMEEMEDEGSMGEEEEGMEGMEGMDEMEESDMEEEEEVPPEEEDDPNLNRLPAPQNNGTILEAPLLCRSVRIGSFKIHPIANNKTMNVILSADGISFYSPMVSDSTKLVNVTVKPCDIVHMIVHFGKCLPIIFIFTTPSFGDAVRRALNMQKTTLAFFDPTSDDDKQKKLTFLIDSVTDEQRRFLRSMFISEKKVQEVDQKTANEILVKSTPSNTSNNTQIIRCEPAIPKSPPQPLLQPPPHIQVSKENVITVSTLQPAIKIMTQPVTRLFTYPPPPQTGGIPITTEDVVCLNEGEFLNDAIIDFYLKYVYYEKLSDYYRDKTHIFSSYFYHRLTHKPERSRARPGEENLKTTQMRRHNQVKTWTRHVDIFSKDFIIIPVNQNVHWFLAIICYPGLVPEAPESPVKPECKITKSSDNVTSTDDQEDKPAKEPNSTVDDENSTTSSGSMFENEEPDSEEPMPEAPDSSTHPDKNVKRRKEVPCICIFDSLNGPNRSRIATMLREYLEVEWKLKKGSRKVFDKNTMQGYIMQCPQQTNYSDCGIYVLQYVESFFENPLPYFDSPIPNLSNWFPKEKVAKKRQELKELISSLHKKFTSNPTIRNANISESVPSSPAQAIQQQNENR